MGFTIYGHIGQLGQMTYIIYKHIGHPFLKMLSIKLDFDWPSGFRGEVL